MGISIESSHIHSQGLVKELQVVVPVFSPQPQKRKKHYCRNQAWDDFDPAPVEPNSFCIEQSIQIEFSYSVIVLSTLLELLR